MAPVDAAAVRRRRIRLSDRGPFPNGCISPIPIGPFGSRDHGSNPSPWVSRAEAHYGIWACRVVKRTASSRGDSAGSSSASWTTLPRTPSGMRFHTRSGRGERSFKASGPPRLCRSYQR